ncbi:MAG: AAA family ATPase, partial [Anaerolineae bacterium]|nr:AAA family ATPase [Anaerolineae bacterium]NIN98789.1 AAA family ATPase [Anaerolineae bacterium]NIQ81705.1 AAA family ATPase [Anaerolineae bacterium]
MKILNLNLPAFGCFTDFELDFNGDGANFHLLYGRNEAGKSTSLRALVDLLYGIPQQTRDNWLHDNERLRIGGTLSGPDGSRLDFARRKGRRDTILDGDGNPIPDAILGQYLGGIP